MGTGKTCTAVAVAEEFIKGRTEANVAFPKTTLKNIVVLTKGKGLQGNFINEVATVCTNGQYLSGLDKYVKNRDQKIRKNVKVNYTFNTFEVFAKSLQKMSRHEKTITYENTLFIVDEAHNLRPSDAEESIIYREIAGLFDLLQSRKILLLTGTPMKDKPEEIVDLFNLIVKEKLTLEDLNDETSFRRKTSGYVSYLRAMMSDVDRTEEGQKLGTLEHFKVYPVFMAPFQLKVYMEAKTKDDEERALFNHSRQASSIVFPDGTYGKIGFEKNIVRTSTGYKFSDPRVRQELQTNLSKYSAKYSDLLENLQNDYLNGRLSFVFSEFVKGSGLVVLSLLLEMNGYVRATADSSFSKPQKRYAIFTNETSTESQTRKLISVFNNPKNLKGEYISTILGSRVIMEGFTFKNIQSEYILTPHWNYSETSQIIARGLRIGSHNDLVQAGIVPNVKIYHYTALSSTERLKDSIDLHMYEISETKDFQIQKVIRTLKEVAFDCALNKARNTITNPTLNYTRNCEYTTCDYKCDNGQIVPEDDDRNYRLLYFRLSSGYTNLKNKIIQMVTDNPITIENIMEETTYSNFEIMTVLHDIISSNEVLFSRPEGSYYLTNLNNIFYASNNNINNIVSLKSQDDPLLLNFYTNYTTIFKGKSIDELIYIHQKNFMVSLIHKVFSSKNLVELQSYMVQLPLFLREKLLCYSISVSTTNTPNNFVRDMVLNNFKLYYKIEQPNAFVWLDPDHHKCTTNMFDYKLWRDCTTDERKKIENIKKTKKTLQTTNNPYGYIGLLNRTTNDFCLQKVDESISQTQDKRKLNVGKRCQNWKKKDLVNLVSNNLKIEPGVDFAFEKVDMTTIRNNPKFENLLSSNGTLKDYKRVAFWNAQDVNYLCNTIKQNFMDKKLVLDDLNCGTSKKIR